MPTPANLYSNGAADEASRTAPVERKKQGEDATKRDPLVARYWREVERYKRAYESWQGEGDEIVKLYLKQDATTNSGDGRKFALLWANVETLKPAVYGRIPQVVCSRRFKDKDPVGRVCAELMERATNTTFDLYGADETFQLVRDDRLLPGRGQAWVRYEAEIDSYQDEDDEGQPAYEDDGETPKMREKLRNEKVCVDYVYWKDFGHNVARAWADVWLVWRKVYKTKDEVTDRWGAKVAQRLAYTAKPPPSGHDADRVEAHDEVQEECAVIFELWDKRERCTSWIAEGEREFLEKGEPPLDFRNFFPCPQPCYATKTSKDLKPRPDYIYYRDQAKEINDLTAKIHNLTRWLIVKGFIPSAPSTVADPIEDAVTDQSNASLFVPVQSMREWTESGGAAKLIDWLPIQHIVVALKAAIDARNQLIQDVFQLSGISDILRGQTDPNETLGAQELKAQTGSRRLKNTRDEHARWCKDIAQLTAEVIAEKFEPENIASITGYRYIPPAPAMLGLGGLPGMGPQAQPGQPSGYGVEHPAPAPAAQAPSGGGGGYLGGAGGGSAPAMPGMQPMMGQQPMPQQQPQDEAADTDTALVFDDRHVKLLRDDKLRSFRIDVETDVTSQSDENMEKERRVEVLGAVGTYLKEALPLVMTVPALAPAIKEFLLFTLRAFRAGRSMEDALERSFDQAIKQAQQAQQQGNPEAEALRAELQLKQEEMKADIQLQMQKMQADIQLETAKMQNEAQLAERELQTTSMLKAREAEQNAQLKAQEANQEAGFRAQEHQANMQNAAAERAMAQRNADEDRKLAAKNADADRKVKAKQQAAKGAKR